MYDSIRVALYVSDLLATPEPKLTEAGRIALAQAVLTVKLAYGDAPAPVQTFRKHVPSRPASQSAAWVLA